MPDKAEVIRDACRALETGEDAAAILRDRLPFDGPEYSDTPVGRPLAVKVFLRDGFIDRYTGKRLVFPGVLRLLSKIFPEAFPYHDNWKMAACHFAYYELWPVVDHLNPRARSGRNDLSNLVTTSTIMNSAKAGFALDQLPGWRLHDPGQHQTWDGLTAWFLLAVERDPSALELPLIRGWHRALLAATAGLKSGGS